MASTSTVSMASFFNTAPPPASISKADSSSGCRAPPPTRVESSADVDADEKLTGDRHRFDALVNRLQQKLSERSEQGSKSIAPAKGVEKMPNNTGSSTESKVSQESKAEKREVLIVHGSRQEHSRVSESSRASSSSFTDVQKERLLASTTSFAASKLREVESNTKTGEPEVEPNTETQPPPLPPRPQPKESTRESTGKSNPPSAETRRGKSTSELDPNQPPFQPTNVHASFSRPSYPGQQAMVLGMAPQPDHWRPIHRQAQSLPRAPVSVPVPAPVPAPFITAPMPLLPVPPGPPVPPMPRLPYAGNANSMDNAMPRWPMSKRPSKRRHDITPFVPISAAEQQKIEEHIELLKSTIPNYATLSKRRQEIRTQGNPQLQQQQRQFSQPHVQSILQPEESAQQHQQMQWHQVQRLQQLQQQMNLMHLTQQDQQFYQQQHPAQPAWTEKPMQPFHPYALYNPNAVGVPTWPMPMINMNM
ncbi:hypothetical protein Sste5344_004877 [Sporothrix stenoceras]